MPAYDDAAGVTAEFNRNLLYRINRELDGTIPVDAFRHVALWNGDKSHIEMHLEAMRDVRFEVDGFVFSMMAGETIHTENSHKYGLRDAGILLRAGGWLPIRQWTDEAGLFSLPGVIWATWGVTFGSWRVSAVPESGAHGVAPRVR